MQWKCLNCGKGGNDFQSDGNGPKWAVCIEFERCGICDPDGEDCYRYVREDGKYGQLNPDDTYEFVLEQKGKQDEVSIHSR